MADDRISRLTLEQKVALLSGADAWHTVGYDDPPIPSMRVSDGPAGVRGTSRTGPPSASFPCGAALGATFDPALIFEVGQALGREAQAKSVHVLLAPTVNLQRTPIGGRNFECFSEDPVLTAGIAVAYITGVQHTGVAACIKHFAGNDTEYERMSISSEIDEATLREAYLVPFEDAVAAGVRVIMSAYNRLNGTFCGEHPWLLTDVLRDEWGFGGVVISDWFGCHSAAPSLNAGLDIEMPGPPIARGRKLVAAVEAGEASEAALDRSIERILALAQWAGADRGATGEDNGTEIAESGDATRDVIRRAAIAGTVLLKNERGLLPLAGDARRIALIGPNARVGQMQGGGSAEVRIGQSRGPLEALATRGLDVVFETGGRIEKFVPPLSGNFDVDFYDDEGHTLATTATRTKWFWDQPPSAEFRGPHFGARVRGTFTPDVSGAWEFGAQAVGALTLRLDDEALIEIPTGRFGGAFFGLGGPEERATVELEGGRAYAVDVDYPVVPDQLIRGMAFGARVVETGDPIARAADVAASADIAVVIVGTSAEFETEGEDRTSLVLPGEQDALVTRVVAANPNTVVVLNSGSPVSMPWLDDVPAVLQVWFPGQEMGDALADVLTGVAEPGGRLPITFPRELAETPAAPFYPYTDRDEIGGKAVYGEGLLIGYRWYDRNDVEPLFPFGHGLGYTTMTIVPAGFAGGAASPVTVSVDVTNTGTRAGSEVVQIYVEPAGADPARPVRQLAAFQRVHVEPGATVRADIVVPPRAFRRWSGDRWVNPVGDHRIHVGRSSRALQPVGSLTITE